MSGGCTVAGTLASMSDDDPQPNPDAVLRPAGIPSRTVVSAPTILIASYVYFTWAEIAIEQEELARVARAELLAAGDDAEVGAQLAREYRAAMQAVAAAAHSIDGLYGVLAPPVRVRGVRQRVILERLKLLFDLRKKGSEWLPRFDWLDDLRDSAVHPKFGAEEAEPHPSGINVARENATYTVETAMQAVDLMLEVLAACMAVPKIGEPDAVRWAEGAREGIDRLHARSKASRNQYPPRTV